MYATKLKQEFDDLRRSISHLRSDIGTIEVKLVTIEREVSISPEQEFRETFPKSKVDRHLFKLVGTQPKTTLKEEKQAIREAVFERFGS